MSVKAFVDGAPLAPAEARAVLHRFIQERLLDEVMVDVTDYSHVHQGPGVVLICHAAHYALDEAGGRPGLTYARKRGPGDLTDAVRAALGACRRLEEQTALRFRGDELQVRVDDRLIAPNTDAAFAELRAALAPVAARLWPDGAAIAHLPDERAPLGARLTGAAATVAELLARLNA